MKIVHIISGLREGGAEAVLYRLCKYDHTIQHQVFSLSEFGKYGPMLEAIGIRVVAFDMSFKKPNFMAIFNLIRLLLKEKPDAVQTWMYHADFIGGVVARIVGIRSIFWGIRHTTFVPGKSKRSTIILTRVLAKLSWFLPHKIVVCASRAKEVHKKIGYDSRKMHVIYNGYDLELFKSLPFSKSDLSLDSSVPLLGSVGRFDPQKDHSNLLDSLMHLLNQGISFQCILVGKDLDYSNYEIVKWIQERNLSKHVFLLGPRNDVPNIMNAIDLHLLSSSFGEAFPNVLCEAMACGTPCVVTDVGDASFIVGETGWVVPPRDSYAFAGAISLALNEMNTHEWLSRCADARNRVEQNFSIYQMIEQYHSLWNSV